MKDQISSAIPAESAELRNDPPVDEQYEEQLSRRALEDLVWRVMDGQRYPKTGGTPVCLDTILCEESDATEVSGVIIRALCSDHSHSEKYMTLVYGIEGIVTNCLINSVWHEQRIAELREEDKEND